MKIDRLISIIMILLEHKKISANRLAEMFEVTARTIYRDVEAISMAGIPIVAYPGINGGIAIMEEYKIEKKLFTISDITALLMGLGSIHSTMSSEEILNTIAKVKGLVPVEQMRDIELRSNQITVDHTPWFGNKNLRVDIDDIKTALNEKRFISFDYSDQRDKKSKRKIEPYRLVLKNSNWYLQGYCITRQDFRTFKLSRLSSFELHEENFTPREFDYKALDSSDKFEKNRITIKLLVDVSLREFMIEFCGEENVKSCENNKLLVNFPFIEDELWYSNLLRFGDKCECLEPEHVRLEVIRRIENLMKNYKKDF